MSRRPLLRWGTGLAATMLALAGLDSLSQRPTILHRFYHSDRLPALFYVSFVADFDVQVCALLILIPIFFSRASFHPYFIVSHA
jgi:hypothetical protein